MSTDQLNKVRMCGNILIVTRTVLWPLTMSRWLDRKRRYTPLTFSTVEKSIYWSLIWWNKLVYEERYYLLLWRLIVNSYTQYAQVAGKFMTQYRPPMFEWYYMTFEVFRCFFAALYTRVLKSASGNAVWSKRVFIRAVELTYSFKVAVNNQFSYCTVGEKSFTFHHQEAAC